jgi:small-conductance mechanosensitive channel
MTAPFIHTTGAEHTLVVGSVRLLGFDPENLRKFIFTIVLFAFLYAAARLLRWLANSIGGKRQRVAFWTGQGISLMSFFLSVFGFICIWFDNPTRLATAAGLVTAGLAFALQKVVTAVAGYFVILRGKTFNIGDRIKMGSVRGDVIALNFIQTVIMEMGEPPSVQEEDPGMWVQSRQYSGRIVTVSNALIFDDAVYNYSRDFPYIWEEMHIPISFKDDRRRAEQIILDAVNRHTQDISKLAQPELDKLKEQFFVEAAELKPRSYMRITDNWVEFAVRFLVQTHNIRGIKDAISRDLMDALDAAGIGIASGTYDIVGLPTLRVEMAAPPPQTARP